MLVAGPRSGSFHDAMAQMIFLAGVTSMTWTEPGQCDVSSSPATQQVMTVLPFASRLAVWKLPSLYPGASAWVNCQTVSPFGLTSRT